MSSATGMELSHFTTLSTSATESAIASDFKRFDYILDQNIMEREEVIYSGAAREENPKTIFSRFDSTLSDFVKECKDVVDGQSVPQNYRHFSEVKRRLDSVFASSLFSHYDTQAVKMWKNPWIPSSLS